MKKSLQDAIREKELPDADYPDFEPGDRIEVTTRVEIGGEKRTRRFEGVCIARRGEGPDQTFKVRKVSFGVGVERLFPLYSPLIESIEVLSKGKVRRAKLNYLEGRSAREARIEEQRADLEAINAPPGTAAPDEETEPDVTEQGPADEEPEEPREDGETERADTDDEQEAEEPAEDTTSESPDEAAEGGEDAENEGDEASS